MRLDYQFDHAFSFSRRKTLDFRNHAQGELEFGIMLGGSCRFTCGSTEMLLRSGDVFFAFPNQPHRYEESRHVDAFLLIVPVKRYLSPYYNLLMKQIPECAVLHKGEYDPSIIGITERALADIGTASEPVIQGYLLVIVGKLLQSLRLRQRQTGTEQALRRVLHYLNEHYRESMSRSDIAKAVGYNESYISHLFSQTMGTSLPEYVHMMRIDDACHMLKDTELTVTQIATELGFGSIRNFNRIFLKRTGVSPKDYRNTFQNKKEATE